MLLDKLSKDGRFLCWSQIVELRDELGLGEGICVEFLLYFHEFSDIIIFPKK